MEETNQDYTSTTYFDEGTLQNNNNNKRINWTFLNERLDNKFFCESNRKIKK